MLEKVIYLVRKAEEEVYDNNLETAGKYYQGAGKLLRNLPRENEYEKAVLDYSTAVCFFNAGAYDVVMKILEGTNWKLMSRFNVNAEELFHEARNLCSAQYREKLRLHFETYLAEAKRFETAGNANELSRYYWSKAITHLASYPYLLNSSDATRLRVQLLKKIGETQMAEQFEEHLKTSKTMEDSEINTLCEKYL